MSEEEVRSDGSTGLDGISGGTEQTESAQTPFHEHPRFKELVGEKNQYRSEADRLRAENQELGKYRAALEKIGQNPELVKQIQNYMQQQQYQQGLIQKGWQPPQPGQLPPQLNEQINQLMQDRELTRAELNRLEDFRTNWEVNQQISDAKRFASSASLNIDFDNEDQMKPILAVLDRHKDMTLTDAIKLVNFDSVLENNLHRQATGPVETQPAKHPTGFASDKDADDFDKVCSEA